MSTSGEPAGSKEITRNTAVALGLGVVGLERAALGEKQVRGVIWVSCGDAWRSVLGGADVELALAGHEQGSVAFGLEVFVFSTESETLENGGRERRLDGRADGRGWELAKEGAGRYTNNGTFS